MFKNKNIVGLDIGTSSVKVAQLEENKRGFQLKALAVGKLPPEVVVEGEVMDVGVVVEKIKELLKEGAVKAKNASIAVLGRSVIIKKIKLPKMKPEELESSIHLEAEQYIPFDTEDVNIDFQVLESDDEDENMDVMLVVVKKEKINDIMNLVIGSKLTPSVIDVDGFALENQYELNCDEEDEGNNVALIDIGASITNVLIMKGGNSVFTRDLSVGGDSYTKSIQQALSLSYEESEKLKLGSDIEEVSRDNIEPLIREVSEEIVDEIQGTFGYFKATYEAENISKIILSGGCVALPGFPEFLESKLEIPVEISNPLKNIMYDEKKFKPEEMERLAPVLSVVIGLALRKVGDRW